MNNWRKNSVTARYDSIAPAERLPRVHIGEIESCVITSHGILGATAVSCSGDCG